MFNFTANAQITTCPDTDLKLDRVADPATLSFIFPYGGLYNFNESINPTTVFSIASPKPRVAPAGILYDYPAKIDLISRSFQFSTDPSPIFNKGEIEFWTQNSTFSWLTGRIRTVDNNPPGTIYDATNMLQTVSTGMAFYDASGPTLQDAVNGAGREVFRIINGNMGVGSTNPLNKFVVQTNPQQNSTMITIDEFNYNPSLRLFRATGFPNTCPTGNNLTEAYGWWIELNDDWQTTGEYGALAFKSLDDVVCPYDNTNLNTLVTFTRDGRVLIGDYKYTGTALSEDLKLSVDGGIVSKELVITLDDWADYVFEDGYNLMDLNDLESSIKANGHLPGIPSAQQVKENGVSVGEMQKQMMAKIEELTLYVIQLKKENDEIKKKLNEVAK